jgi:hypothetical protein
MRWHWRRRAGLGALAALLLQLGLPFVAVAQAAARTGLDGPFVICTGAGLVWIDPRDDETPASDHESVGSCIICLTQHLAVPLLVPAEMAEPGSLAGGLPTRPAVLGSVTATSAPPLPARGPPALG